MTTRFERSRSASPGATINEFEYARTIAQRFETDHHEIEIDWGEAESFLDELVFHQDEPIADYTCVPVHYLARLARDTGTIVVQVGEGSDELFHGYEHYHEHARFHRGWGRRIGRLPAPLRHGAGRSLSSEPRSVSAAERRGCGSSRTRSLTATRSGAGRSPSPATCGSACSRTAVERRRPVRGGRTALARGRARAPRRGSPPEDDLRRAEAAARRAALDARRQDDDGDFGRGSRAVPRPRARRVRARAPRVA